MDGKALGMVFDAVLDGWDFSAPGALLKVSGKRASIRPDGAPYSMAQNLWHAVYWQELWLRRIRGESVPPQMEVWKGDWQTPDEEDFAQLRERFESGLREARSLCDDELTDLQADRLVRIAMHGAYHMGQLALLKRTKPRG